MITRKTLLIDRLTTLVVGLLLILGGLVAVWWWSGDRIDGSALPSVSDTSAVTNLIDTDWFAWAGAVVGLLLAVIGVRWIAAYVTTEKVRRLTLSGSNGTGRLDVAAQMLAAAAADAYSDTLGVRSVSGSVIRDRGQIVARISAVIEPRADLGHLARRADALSAQFAAVLGRDDLRCTVELRVAARGRALSRAA